MRMRMHENVCSPGLGLCAFVLQEGCVNTKVFAGGGVRRYSKGAVRVPINGQRTVMHHMLTAGRVGAQISARTHKHILRLCTLTSVSNCGAGAECVRAYRRIIAIALHFLFMSIYENRNAFSNISLSNDGNYTNIMIVAKSQPNIQYATHIHSESATSATSGH